MVQQTVETFGRLDVIVNNAGVTRYLNIMEVTEADWDRIHRVNAKGVFFCMQRAAQQMIAQGQGEGLLISPPSPGRAMPAPPTPPTRPAKGPSLR